MRNLIGWFRRVWLDAILLTAMTMLGLEACAGIVRLQHNPQDGDALVVSLMSIMALCVLLPVFNWRIHRQTKGKE